MFIITGGGSGIGKALALALAKREKQVLIIGRREQHLREVASISPLMSYLSADVSTNEGIQLIKEHIANIPHIEGLVNNAGIIEPLASVKEIKLNEWQHTFRTNLDAPLLLSQIMYEKLANGRVLNIGSGAAYFAVKGWAAYCTSKAALSLLTKAWQLESDSVAFASVKPGIADTDMQAIARTGLQMDPENTAFYKRLKEANRLVSAETVAEFLVWLLLEVDRDTYVSQEWDIYDSVYHPAWLKPPHQVLHWEF